MLPIFLPSSRYIRGNEVAVRILVGADVIGGILYGDTGFFEVYGSRPAFEVVG